MDKVCASPECDNIFTVSRKGRNNSSICNTHIYCSTECSKRHEYLVNSLEYKWRLGKLAAAAKFRAKDKNLDYNLTTDYLIGLWDATGGKCVLTNQVFDLTSWGKKGQVSPQAPSIDRIIPSKGYVIGNIRLVCYHINVALSEYGISEFDKLVAAYTKHRVAA